MLRDEVRLDHSALRWGCRRLCKVLLRLDGPIIVVGVPNNRLILELVDPQTLSSASCNKLSASSRYRGYATNISTMILIASVDASSE